MKINGKKIKALDFAWDGCHKIYLLRDNNCIREAKKYGYDIYPLNVLRATFERSCPLRFIEYWDDFQKVIGQGEDITSWEE